MKVSIHQPNYLPGIGYFSKISKSDIHLFLDNVEYSKGDFINRNKICINNSEHFLTVPVSKKHSNSLINSIPLPVDSNWKNKHILTITQNYKKCDFYDEFSPPILNCIQNHEGLLCDLNIKLIKIICELLNISSTFMKSSDFNIDQSLKSTERLIYLLKEINGSTYISGFGAKDYMDIDLFSSSGIKIEWNKFNTNPYKQNSKNFIRNLSIIDILFNVGHKCFFYF